MWNVICGDCREILKTLDAKNSIIVTDPPFNIGYHYNEYKDRMPEDEYMNMLGGVLKYSEKFVVVHYPEELYKLSHHIGMVPNRVVSWVYNSNTRKQHRDIAYFGVSPDFSKMTQPYKNPNDKRIKKLIANGRTGSKLYDWWNVNQVKNVSKEKTEHPCQMPVLVMERIVGILPDDVTIIDPFCGSGTTGIACLRQGRDFIGIEIDERYANIAKQRLQQEDYMKTRSVIE